MLKLKLFSLYIFIKTIVCPCYKDTSLNAPRLKNHSKIHLIGRLPTIVNESSGLVALDSTTFLTHNDGGGRSEIYKVDSRGDLLNTYQLPCKNIDWEEITTDFKGSFYIGDFGNNSNERRNLRIYKTDTSIGRIIDTINFVYIDQEEYPPLRKLKNFDCEAFFVYGDSLFLFSKNRGKGPVKMYGLSKNIRQQSATIRQTLPIKGMVTACAFEPTLNVCAILSYGKVYFYKVKNSDGAINLSFLACRKFANAGQSEAISFLNDHTLIISNEGGRLFSMTIDKDFWRVNDTSKK